MNASFFSLFFPRAFSEPLPVMPLARLAPFWETDPSFDTHYNDCFGIEPIDAEAPGSGFLMAWTDGRDPGPVGNNGVDPNVFFVATEGPPLPTELTASVRKTKQKLKPQGTLNPEPIPDAKVVVTLFRDTGDGFEQVARRKPKTGDGGAWLTSFARPDGGTCRVVIEFGGAVGRAPSVPVTKTFAC